MTIDDSTAATTSVEESPSTANLTFEPLVPEDHADAAHDDASAEKPAVVADGNSELTLRALVSTKEAGVIIGKGGKNVAELRELTGVKAGVSKVVPGVHDRVLSVTGTLDGVAKAYAIIAQTLLDNPVSAPADPARAASAVTSLRLLISHNLMGTIIGRQGLKIKYIQDVSGARMVASKEMLPQSTERVVEVQGMVDSIRVAVWEIGKCLIEDWERGVGTVLYNPAVRLTTNTALAASFSNPGSALTSPVAYSYGGGAGRIRSGNGSVDFGQGYGMGGYDVADYLMASNIRTQQISIPGDMVGCIIGKAGSKISEIRRLSGSRISIAKVPHDETGERMFTITGTPESNEKALYLLYSQLESEKERRMHAGAVAGITVAEEEAQ
jgi:heterogeneous nuclear rnp K-like protein 2